MQKRFLFAASQFLYQEISSFIRYKTEIEIYKLIMKRSTHTIEEI